MIGKPRFSEQNNHLVVGFSQTNKKLLRILEPMNPLRIFWLSSAAAMAFTLAACGSKPVVEPPLVELSPAEATAMAMKLWRDDDLTRHPKGSCSGCHGADFFDLARNGATNVDLERRARIDGASAQEAKALIQAIGQMRLQYQIPVTNARAFRPFQPSGAQILPDLTDAPHIAAVKRDIAFAQNLEPLLPTLYGAPIDSLEKAKKARDELLDLVKGSNLAGANPQMLNLRKLPTGVLYPLWSADLHHSPAEGTFNDWIADIAHDAKPARKAEWHALQNTYLENPNNQTFWKMYVAAKDMTQVPLLGACTADGINPQLACGAMDDFNRHKFLSALIGQHMMRLETLGRLEEFFADGIAFTYLETDPSFAFTQTRGNTEFLPANPWEIGDMGRTMLESTQATGSFRDNLRKLGYPEFALNSIDAARAAGTEEQALRLTWFWIGFTFDPSFARISGSNATKVAEYMVGSLIEERMFNHNAFMTLIRLASKGTLPEANVKIINKQVIYQPIKFIMNFSYFIGYGRAILSNTWNESKNLKFPTDLKTESTNLYSRLTGNGFRMATYLQIESLEKDSYSTADLTSIRGWLSDSNNNGTIKYGTIHTIQEHFTAYHSSTATADTALLELLKTKSGAVTY